MAPNIVGVALGEFTTCIRRSDDRVACRGVLDAPPTLLPGALDVTDLAVCARTGGTVRCLREGSDQEAPTAFVEIVLGSGGASCGRDPDGGVWCFTGTTEDGATLRPVTLASPARRLVGASRTFVLEDDGVLVAFDPYAVMTGTGDAEPIADGVLELDGTLLEACWRTEGGVTCERDTVRRRVRGVDHPTNLAVGLFHGCVLEAGVPRCWGRDLVAKVVEGLDRIVAIDAGSFHTCAVRDDGDLRCWGADKAGQVSGAFPF